jgi:Transposase and inactivated derivatives
VKFRPSEYAASSAAKAYVKFTVTIVNGTGKTFDPSMFSASAQSANLEADEVYDTAGGLNGSPDTKLLKGREAKFVIPCAKLEWIAKTDPRLYRAYLLKEGLRMVFVLKGEAGKDALGRWISWARRCRIPAFVNLQKRIVRHRKTIDATLEHGLSNGLIESTNTKIRVLTRMAFGFTKPEALVALAMLALGGYCPPLPGRETRNDPRIGQGSQLVHDIDRCPGGNGGHLGQIAVVQANAPVGDLSASGADE